MDFKKDDPFNKPNYKPRSLLPNQLKVYEKIVNQ